MKAGVGCTFLADGTVQVQRVEIGGRWQPVGQGRQWLDEAGRHVLVMLPDDQIYELTLRYDILTWEIRPIAPPGSIRV
jgi:hypothetical protein